MGMYFENLSLDSCLSKCLSSVETKKSQPSADAVAR